MEKKKKSQNIQYILLWLHLIMIIQQEKKPSGVKHTKETWKATGKKKSSCKLKVIFFTDFSAPQAPVLIRKVMTAGSCVHRRAELNTYLNTR